MPSGNRRYVDVPDGEFEKVWHQNPAPIAEIKADLVRPKLEGVEKIEGKMVGRVGVEPTAR